MITTTSPYPRQSPLPPQNIRRSAYGPNSVMSMAEIASIFAGEGNSPDDAAMRIQSTWSPQARNVLNQSWERTGISQFPEDYFNRAINEQKAAEMAAMQREVNARPIADPVEERLNLGRRIAGQRFATNANAVQDPLRNQLRGDVYGDVAKTIRSLSGGRMEPYSTSRGFGGLPSDSTTLDDRLDENLLRDEAFLDIMKRDPRRGKFVYERLTGRQYDADLAGRKGIEDERAKTAISMVRNEAANDMQYDPETGLFMVMRSVQVPSEVDPSKMETIKQLVPASPILQKQFQRYAPRVLGNDFVGNSDVVKATRMQQLQGGRRSPEEIAAFEAKKAAIADIQNKVANGMVRNPYTGEYLIQQETEVADPTNPNGVVKIKRYQPVTPILQSQYSKYGQEATGELLPEPDPTTARRYKMAAKAAQTRLTEPRDYSAYLIELEKLEQATGNAASPDAQMALLNRIEQERSAIKKTGGFWENLGKTGNWIGELAEPVYRGLGLDRMLTGYNESDFSESQSTQDYLSSLTEGLKVPETPTGRRDFTPEELQFLQSLNFPNLSSDERIRVNQIERSRGYAN